MEAPPGAGLGQRPVDVVPVVANPGLEGQHAGVVLLRVAHLVALVLAHQEVEHLGPVQHPGYIQLAELVHRQLQQPPAGTGKLRRDG